MASSLREDYLNQVRRSGAASAPLAARCAGLPWVLPARLRGTGVVANRPFEHRVAEHRPHLRRPRAELALGERHAAEPGHRVHPQEGAAGAEVPERGGRVPLAGPMRIFVPPDLEREAPEGGTVPPQPR